MTPEERMRRGRSVRLHVIVALCTLLVLIAVNALTSSGYPWWIWVLMVWMPIVAGPQATLSRSSTTMSAPSGSLPAPRASLSAASRGTVNPFSPARRSSVKPSREP